MPVAVFIVGCLLSTEKFTPATFGNLMVVSAGVAVASYGAFHAACQTATAGSSSLRMGAGGGRIHTSKTHSTVLRLPGDQCWIF